MTLSNEDKSIESMKGRISSVFIRLGPLADFWMAFLVYILLIVTNFIIISFTGHSESDLYTEYYQALAALIVVSLAAWIGGMLVNFVRHKFFSRKANLLSSITVPVIHYLCITFLAAIAISIYGLTRSSLMNAEDILVGYILFFLWQPMGCVAYTVLFFATYAIGVRPKQILPVRSRIGDVVISGIVASIILWGLATTKPETQDELVRKFESELVRIGDLAPRDNEALTSNRIKFYEKKYGLEVTGKVSPKLIEFLKREDTKLEYTIGAGDSDSESLGRVCDNISRWDVNDVRKSLGISNGEIIQFNIRIKDSFVPQADDKCFARSVDGPIRVLIVPVNNKVIDSRTRAIELNGHSVTFETYRMAKLSIKHLAFSANGRSDAIILDGNVEFDSNSVSLPSNRTQWGIVVRSYGEKDIISEISASKLVNAPILVLDNAHATVSGNSFIGNTYVETEKNGVADSSNNTISE